MWTARGDFRLMKREMVDAIVSMCEYNRFSKGIFGWIGFKTKWLPYKNVERVAGETKWSFFKLFKYSLDGIVNFSQAPLSIASVSGLMSYGHRLLYDSFRGDPPPDLWRSRCGLGFHRLHHPIHRRRSASAAWASWGSIWLKTYLEVKSRPHFIISETNDKDAKRIG